MTYPWEQKSEIDKYIKFLDTHTRVRVAINGHAIGTFSVLDEGTDLNVETIMPDGTPLVFKVDGHPRTTDPTMTVMELVNYVLTNYKG